MNLAGKADIYQLVMPILPNDMLREQSRRDIPYRLLSGRGDLVIPEAKMLLPTRPLLARNQSKIEQQMMPPVHQSITNKFRERDRKAPCNQYRSKFLCHQ